MQIVGGKNLNAEQRWAIASFIMGAGIGAPFTIYGPPGTGKTVTLVECALQVDVMTQLLHVAPLNGNQYLETGVSYLLDVACISSWFAESFAML